VIPTYNNLSEGFFMGLSPRKKFYWMLFILLMVGCFFIVLWALTNKLIFLVLLMVWVFVGSWLVKSVKCPNCGVSVSYQGKIGAFPINAALARGTCRNCGYDLTKVIKTHA
jgi:hypothetical protein